VGTEIHLRDHLEANLTKPGGTAANRAPNTAAAFIVMTLAASLTMPAVRPGGRTAPTLDVGSPAVNLLRRLIVTVWLAMLFGRDSGNRHQRRIINGRREVIRLVVRSSRPSRQVSLRTLVEVQHRAGRSRSRGTQCIRL